MPVPLRDGGLDEPRLQPFGLLEIDDVVELDKRPLALDHSTFGRPAASSTGLPWSSQALRYCRKQTHMMGVPFSPSRTCPQTPEPVVGAPAPVTVAEIQRVHGEVHGVAAAVVAPAGEVVRQDSLAVPRTPRWPRTNIPTGPATDQVKHARRLRVHLER